MRDREFEATSYIFLAFNPYFATMTFDKVFAKNKAYSSAFFIGCTWCGCRF
jgi:hypothetical protein